MRTIQLTSITTILGLAPLPAEKSFQARFLVPMGLSIAGGVAFATVLALVAVPSLYMILLDFQRAGARVVAAPGLATTTVVQRKRPVDRGAGI